MKRKNMIEIWCWRFVERGDVNALELWEMQSTVYLLVREKRYCRMLVAYPLGVMESVIRGVLPRGDGVGRHEEHEEDTRSHDHDERNS